MYIYKPLLLAICISRFLLGSIRLGLHLAGRKPRCKTLILNFTSDFYGQQGHKLYPWLFSIILISLRLVFAVKLSHKGHTLSHNMVIKAYLSYFTMVIGSTGICFDPHSVHNNFVTCLDEEKGRNKGRTIENC